MTGCRSKRPAPAPHRKKPPVEEKARPSQGGFLFTVIRSDRRTMAIEIGQDRRVKVRVPRHAREADVLRFVDAYGHLVARRLHTLGDAQPEPDEDQVLAWKQRAQALLPAMADRWAKALGVQHSGLSITAARTRFGSCSSKGRLCFSLYLMRYPMQAIDYVVLHEVCHLLHMNHGAGFYALLSKHMPDYRERRKLLRRPIQEDAP